MLKYYQDMGLLGHNGIDFIAKDGERLYWDCDISGVVIDTHIDGSGGLGVKVITQDKDGDFKHLFWHLKSFACQAGDILDSGDLLGYADNTGRSTGTHLHRSIKPVYLNSNGNWINTYGNNGYYGAVDLQPYFKNIFVKDLLANLRSQVSILQKVVELFKKLINLLK